MHIYIYIYPFPKANQAPTAPTQKILRMDSRHSSISVLMFPWLAHDHISPFLDLAKKLTNRNFHIYFCSTPINLGPIKQNLYEKHSQSIQLVEIHLPSPPCLTFLHTTIQPMAYHPILCPPSKRHWTWLAQTSTPS